jgi:glycerol-1-phosphate dehydrogenase [NAD(P)+]
MSNPKKNKFLPVYIGVDALSRLVAYCKQQRLHRFLLVCDGNTYRAFGEKVEAALKGEGFDVALACLDAQEVIPNEYSLIQVLLKPDREERIYLAVGTGTITDITRFVSHRTKATFVSLPTAASVDGFTSIGAALIVGGLKKTIICEPPTAIFADLPTLCSAPACLAASGFGDMIGKLLSSADWELGHVLWDEPFDREIKERMQKAAYKCIDYAVEIGKGYQEGIYVLMDGLIEAGLCMLDFGNSAPASGAEHHISHLWEMRRLQAHQPTILHGAKVGVASVITAKWYGEIQKLTPHNVSLMLNKSPAQYLPETIRNIRDIYGSNADEIIQEQSDFLNMTEDAFSWLKDRITARWGKVRKIAEAVPSAEQVAGYLRSAGSPVSCAEIGLQEDEIQIGLDFSHYLRNRFTINKLRLILGLN